MRLKSLMTNYENINGSGGVLYVVATPIGNREDITLRALNILKTVDMVVAEDTRHTGRLLGHFDIRSHLVSYHKFNERQRTTRLIDRLLEGKSIALVSSAGTPGVSDPGSILVRAAAAAGIRVSPIPGPSALVAALSASGLDSEGFVFLGFPPKKKGRREALLVSLAQEPRTLIWYESPQRILVFIGELIGAWGDREAVACRELTKLHEEFIRGRLSAVAENLRQREDIRGEFTLMVTGNTPDETAAMEDALAEIRDWLLEYEGDTNCMAKTIAKKYGLPKKIVYREVLKAKKNRDKNICAKEK